MMWPSHANRRTIGRKIDQATGGSNFMTPAARIQAAVDLTEALLPLERPADQIVAAFLRQRRYIGGGDRRRILEFCRG